MILETRSPPFLRRVRRGTDELDLTCRCSWCMSGGGSSGRRVDCCRKRASQRTTEPARQRSCHTELSAELKKAGYRDVTKIAAFITQLDAPQKTIVDLEDQAKTSPIAGDARTRRPTRLCWRATGSSADETDALPPRGLTTAPKSGPTKVAGRRAKAPATRAVHFGRRSDYPVTADLREEYFTLTSTPCGVFAVRLQFVDNERDGGLQPYLARHSNGERQPRF